ncbi:nascent polypeptide-associated complex subunit alpha, muscle-specific form isoform X1 [Haplochromis burtoni]|uniref:nascent polypeptide-associated complex subunit alpha, muscle-specific form isoform X1 n=1 Tax=Haplochromis burtoni TaxID=8153 RepID=UPI0003BC9CCE|nr:nascent polypeptide-associated complex subunit alpha, muscle-specific form isoform X1 [Haplochromis burtoni]
MDRELVRQSQSDHGEATNGTSPPTAAESSATPPTPTPPRLTPNPMLLDSPAPSLTPTTSSPPPPLTPAPSITTNHGPKAAAATAGAPSPHVLVPTPPKLTSTPAPALRTYSRHNHSSKMSSSVQTPPSPSLLPPPSSSSSPVVATAPSPLLSSSPTSSATHNNTTMSAKISTSLTNGSARVLSATSTPITPFHTPASPPGRQVSQTPVGTPGLVRTNQNPSPVRHPKVSQQTLLLGKGLKGTGQDQVLLRAQMLILTSAMRPPQPCSSSSSSSVSTSPPSSNPASAQLQSLTLRPPPPGTLAIPPSLRLKPNATAPPPLSRPQAPLFPILKPRPQSSITATECPTTPSRHLAVPPPSRSLKGVMRPDEYAPPSLYSPVRAVPLRPRLHSPNGHRAASPRQTSALQPIAAAPSSQASSISRPLVGLKSCPLTHSPVSVSSALSAVPHFERSLSAAKQLQIIALSSGRQPQPGTYTHASVQPPPPAAESPEVSAQSKRTLSTEDVLPPPPLPPLNPSLPKTTSPLPSPPSLLSPASPQSQAEPQPQNLTQKVEVKEAEEQRKRAAAVRQEVKDEESIAKDLRVEKDDQREKVKEEEPSEEQISQEVQEVSREEDQMEVTEEGQSERERREEGKDKKMEEEEEGETPMDQSENQTAQLPHQYHNTDPIPEPDPVKDSTVDSKPITGLISTPLPVQTPAPVPVPEPAPVPEASAQSQRLPEPQKDLQPVSQEDFCENMSTQSDNQSALSSLSSQSPPSSPITTPSAENPPPLLPAHTALPTDLSLPQHEPAKVDKAGGEQQPPTETEAEPLGQLEDESESFSQSLSSPWEPRPWPEGRQVLTHLVEGFVIQEGLQPFPVNRSSLLVPEQVPKPQEVNGTNGKAALPVTETIKQTEHSTDSDEEEGGDTDDPGSRSGHRDRTVLHCQFCGKRGHAHNFMRSKRFCSTSCARGFNVRLTKRLRALSAGSRSEKPRPALNRAESVPGKPLLLRLPRDLWSAGQREKDGKEKAAAAEEDEDEDDMVGGGGREEEDDDGGEEDPAVAMTARMERRAARRARRASAPAVTTSTPTTTFKPAPSQWSVEEVTAFIHTLPGCSDVAEAFRVQEIDGQALLLLTEDHLMTSMNIKLGPALKICAHINALKNQ